MDRMYVCICVTAAQRFLRFTPFALCHPAPSGAITMPASSWTTCESALQPQLVSSTELVSSTGAVYSVREQATQRKCWLEWMDEYAASGLVKWKPIVVDTRLDGNGQREVRKTALTGTVKGLAVKVAQRQQWEMGVGSIVWHHSLVQNDMFGWRGWMTGDPAGVLEARLKSHWFVSKPSLSWCSNKVNDQSPASSHECLKNFRFKTLDGESITMG